MATPPTTAAPLARWAFAAALCCGCGRTQIYFPAATPPGPVCTIVVAPASLAFGSVAVAAPTSRALTVTDTGGASCNLFGFAIVGGGTGFALPAGQPASLTLQPGGSTEISVAFAPPSTAAAGSVSATLSFASNDPTQEEVGVPLTATIPRCGIAVSPLTVDFGLVPFDTTVSQIITVTSTGGPNCPTVDLAAVNFVPGGDPFFTLGRPSAAVPATIASGQSWTIAVDFDEPLPASQTSHAAVLDLTFDTGAPAPPTEVQLTATTPLGCSITALPNPLSFGNVGLNQTLTETVTIQNQGMLPCTVSDIALVAGDPLFTLAAVPPSAILDPGETLVVAVSFDAAVSTPPFQHNGTLTFASTDAANPTVDVPLSAFVNTVCSAASQWIYTVDTDGTLSQFDPLTLTFTEIGVLDCEGGQSPFAMAVDQNAVAWVVYEDGNLFQVDTSNAGCSATSFQPDQDGLDLFGMGFVFDPTSGVDTLYVAGAQTYPAPTSTLAKIAFPSLQLTTVAPVTFGFPDLTGTGDGQLWGFAANETSSGLPTLAQIDPATGDVLQSFTYPTLTGSTFAMKFWGGSFWIFLTDGQGNSSVYQIPRDTGVLSTAIVSSPHEVVGAGVSTCAPVE